MISITKILEREKRMEREWKKMKKNNSKKKNE